MKHPRPSCLWSSLTPQHDALTDYLTDLRHRLACWKLATVASLTALLVTAAIRHPAVFVMVLCIVAMVAVLIGGWLYSAYRGDLEMGLADTTDRTTNH